MRKAYLGSAAVHITIVGGFLCSWELLGRSNSRLQFLFARPSLVIQTMIQDLVAGSLVRNFVVTGAEASLGFLIGGVVGTVVGLLLWYWPYIAQISSPYVIAFGAIPLFALAPMMIVWFGTGFDAKVALAALSTVGVALSQAYRGALSADEGHLRLMASFGASRWFVFRKVIVPTSLIWVSAAARLNIGFAILGAFIGEFLSANSGLGYSVLRAGGLYDMPRVIVGVIALVVLSYSMRAGWIIVEKFANFPGHMLDVRLE